MIIATIILLFVFGGLLYLGAHLTGALISGLFWVGLRFPLAIVFGTLAIVCCCTLVLIPLGILFFKIAGKLLFPVFA